MVDPQDMACEWVGDVRKLLEGCTIPSTAEEDWGWMIVMLSDLADELTLYWGPFWNSLNDLEQRMNLIRMDLHAQGLLAIFTRRGYTPADEPFNPPEEE